MTTQRRRENALLKREGYRLWRRYLPTGIQYMASRGSDHIDRRDALRLIVSQAASALAVSPNKL